MRISDWSSDVCSSDLHARAQDDIAAELAVERIAHVTRIAIVRRRVAQEEGQHRRAGELLKLDPLDTIVVRLAVAEQEFAIGGDAARHIIGALDQGDRKSTRLNSSH